jgi:hypothetical protein
MTDIAAQQIEHSRRGAAKLLALLRRNDPSITSVTIWLELFPVLDDYELSEALESNDHINHIIVWFCWRVNSNTNCDSLLRVLATRENFERVELHDDWRNPPERVAPFLLSIQQNPRIQRVDLIDVRLSSDLFAAFLDTATSITALYLGDCVMEAPGDGLAVAAALQRNRNIRQLILSTLDDVYLIPILSNLGSNTSVEALHLWLFILSLDASRALGCLLESTKTIRKFEFKRYNLYQYRVDLNTFQPVAEGLIRSASVTDVQFKGCKFIGQNKMLMMNSILESKSNLQSLTLDCCLVPSDERAEFSATIISLLQRHSLLRDLELSHDHLSAYGFDLSQNFARLLTAVATSPLERFSIGSIDSREICLALIASISSMHVQTLELTLDGELQDLNMAFLQAVKRNASLSTVVALKRDDSVSRMKWVDWFGHDNSIILRSYMARNQFLAEWIENPTAVPRAAWPEYLAVAQTTGPDTVFRILQALTYVPVSWFEGA